MVVLACTLRLIVYEQLAPHVPSAQVALAQVLLWIEHVPVS
jgi:hypothetical protein